MIADGQRRLAATAPGRSRTAEAETAVTALYQAHAVGLIRLAVIMLGDRPAAEDAVQEAFTGLYRRWDHLAPRSRPASRSAAATACPCGSATRAARC